jgi:hypothetical protein
MTSFIYSCSTRLSVANLPQLLSENGITSIELPDGRTLAVEFGINQTWLKEAIVKDPLTSSLYLEWRFFPEENKLFLKGAALKDLPSWVRIEGIAKELWFDPERGFPIMSVMKALAVNKLECFGKVDKVCLFASNIETTIDIAYSWIVKNQSFRDSCVDSKSALLAREASEMAGISLEKLKLTDYKTQVGCWVTKHNFGKCYNHNVPPPNSDFRKYENKDKLKSLEEAIGDRIEYIATEIYMLFSTV